MPSSKHSQKVKMTCVLTALYGSASCVSCGLIALQELLADMYKNATDDDRAGLRDAMLPP